MPGHPAWHLAPREMAWEGKTIGEICEQIRDPARNGGRKVEALIDHIGKDTLLGWAWKPPASAARPRQARRSAGRRAGRGLGEDGSSVPGAVIGRGGEHAQTSVSNVEAEPAWRGFHRRSMTECGSQ